jgi:hypothetical protein
MKHYILAGVLFFTLISCNKDKRLKIEKGVVNTGAASIETLQAFFGNPETGGRFVVLQNSRIGDKDESLATTIVNGSFRREGINLKGEKNKFAYIEVECDPSLNTYYKDVSGPDAGKFFGKKINIQLGRKGEERRISQDYIINTASGYNPQSFTCTNEYVGIVYNYDWTILSATPLAPDSFLYWNKDTQNTKGVFIYLEYDPLELANKQMKDAGFNKRQGNFVMVDDIGSYTLTDELFIDIPANAQIEVYIGRGNFEYLRDTQNNLTDIQFASLTFQTGYFQYKTK